MYDLIGDIHGHCTELEVLLDALGYQQIEDSWIHPEGRKVIFVGDYIDRGPQILETVRLVRKMVEYGNAIALMGNHEFNALAYYIRKPDGEFCRSHTEKNRKQHGHTLEQMQGHEYEFKYHLDWFLTLPLFIDFPEFRAVHACWDQQNIDRLVEILAGNKLRSAEDVIAASDKSTELYRLIEETLKGKEINLPEGITFQDKDEHQRSEIRIKWWEDPANTTFYDYSVVPLEDLPHTPVTESNNYYPSEEKAVFFGHYWLSGDPVLQKPNVCCLDYSVAKGGSLVAYSWDGMEELDFTNFVTVSETE
jgi:hypothetical protein